MKVSLDIQDSKADFVLEMLQNFKFIKIDKTKKLTAHEKQKAKIKRSLTQAFKEVKLHQEGKIKLKTAQELLDEL